MVPTLLVVDDDDAYSILIPRALRTASSSVSLKFLTDGEHAIEYLSGKEIYSDRVKYPFPNGMLLDLKMPKINGFEVLEWKRQHPELGLLPVIVWSSSDLDEDRSKAISLGAACYICKPDDYTGLADIIRRLEKYCIELNSDTSD